MEVRDIFKGKFSFEWLLIVLLLGALFYSTWRFRYGEGVTGTINFIQTINKKDQTINELQQKLNETEKAGKSLEKEK